MNISQKLEIVAASVRSISRHNDEDAAVVQAALAKIDALVKAEREALDARVRADIEAKLKG